MARLLKSDRAPERSGRRLSFKTRERKAGVRSVRVVSGAVSDIAAKFNAVVVEDQGELLRKLHDEHQGAQVRATVHKFEAMGGQRTRVLLVRRNSAAVQEKPKVHPKPTVSVGRVSAGSYVKKDMREIIGKDKKFSLPRTHILDEVLNEVPDEKKPAKVTKIHRSGKIRKSTSPEPIQQLDSKPSGTTNVTDDMNSKTYENTKFDEIKEKLLRCTVGTIEPSEVKSVKTSCDVSTEKSEQLNNTKTEQSITITLTAPEPKSPEEQKEQLIDSNKAEKEISKMIKPNRSFLWGVTESVTETDVVVTEAVITNSEESGVKSAQATSQATSDRLVEDKENLEKLETPVIRKVDKKGYGKINVVANSSSLYRNILRQSLIEELKERATVLKDRSENIPQEEPPIKKEDHQEEYEDVGQDTYEVIENNYDEIREDAIYDDVLHSEQIYESIYGGRLLGDCDTYSGRVPGDSDSSCDQSNSLYGLRPPSRSSSGSGARGSAASRSDSSDDWVDIEMEEHQHQHHILLIEAAGQKRSGGNWSQKVRRQWSARKADLQGDEVSISSTSLLYLNSDPEVTPPEVQPVPLNTLGLVSLREVWFSGSAYEVQEVTIYILNRDDSDSCGKHYELVENLDDDSALCDDFEDSSDSEFSVENNEKAFVHEQERIRESDGIYGLMKEAGKRMRKTSSTIGKSLRKISRISKTTSAQDIFNGTNGMMSRGRWPSFKKKNLPQTKSMFYLTDSGLSTGSTTSSVKAREPASVPPPRPPPPDPRRLSLSTRPTSPPPPPPPAIVNGTSGNDSKTAVNKAINDTSLYAECGLFEQNPNAAGLPSELRRLHDNSWYSDIGLYENSKPSDTCSDHDSSRGSDLDLRFADEPLYQFYAERVAKRELSEDISETWYEEIGENRIVQPTSRPTALELVSPEMQRTLWCQVPQVIESGILDSLSTERKKLQEAKFEVVTSEASYYKSLSILEKHFAASPLLKDESILPKVHYKTLFSNVPSVRKCSEAVLAALEKCWQESILLEGLSEVINKVAEENFSAYIKYCKHQLAMEKTIKFLKKSNQAFSDALDTLEKSPMCHNLTFYSFVLLPMQRITRMPLLQDAILTKLTPDDPEYDSCRIALARLNKIVHDCNEAARQTERLEEMVMLSRALQFPPEVRPLPLMSASRWLVRSGDVSQISLEPRTTFSRKLTTPRTVKLRLFLFTDYLVIAKKKSEDSFSVVTYCERNLVHMSDVEEAFSNKFLIMLTLIKNHEGKTQEMVLCCGGESSRARWISAMSPPAATNPGERLYEGWDCPQVFVQHAYLAGQPDELSLQYGDVIDVLRKTDDGWYYGERMRDSEKGWFPGNHTSEIPSSHVRARNLKQRYRLLALSSSFIQKQQMSKLNPS